MSYVVQTDIEAMIPSDFLVQALNDSGEEGGESAGWVKVAQAVDDQINALLSVGYTVPLVSPCPTLIKEAAKVLAASLCYKRRGKTGDGNPWGTSEANWIKRLEKIGKGEELVPELLAQKLGASPSGGAVISEDSKLYNSAGGLMV